MTVNSGTCVASSSGEAWIKRFRAKSACQARTVMIRTPPDLVLGLGLLDDELVLGRAAGVEAGADYDRTEVHDVALLAPDHVLIQHGRVVVPVLVADVVNAVPIEAEVRADAFGRFHGQLLQIQYTTWDVETGQHNTVVFALLVTGVGGGSSSILNSPRPPGWVGQFGIWNL
jgi:hypothetical protein